MKNLKFLLIAFVTVSILFACKKDKPGYPEENPLPGYISQAELSKTDTVKNSAAASEFGIKFTPTVKGKINALVFKIPNAVNDTRVMLWKTSTKEILRTEHITNIVANIEKIIPISGLILEKDVSYTLTYNGNNWYKRTKPSGGTITYPVTVGNIKIEGYGWSDGSNAVYPTKWELSYYGGDLSFVFQQID